MKRLLFLILLGTVAAMALVVAVSAPNELSKPAQHIVDYLLEDWQKSMHSTPIAQAMENLGMAADDALRLQVGEHFRAHKDLHFNLRSWGVNNYLLSDEEKRMAKLLINTYDDKGQLPELGSMSLSLDIGSDRLKSRLDFLRQAGLLTPSAGSELGYGLTRKYRRWGGPLRFNYHTVTIGGEKPFAVW
ncbi:MAG: hypothetical protein ACE5JX_06935 [Acidobacteriota bacterium]